MFRKLSIVTIVVVIAMLFSQLSFAQSGLGTSQNIAATANVYATLATSGVSAVIFSNIAVGYNPVINASGGGLTTAHVGASASAGGFTVTGSSGATITVTFAGQGVLTDAGSNSMKFTPYVATTGTIPYTTGTNVVLTAGSRVFSVGGTLYSSTGAGIVPTNQAAGSYSTANTGGTPVTFTIDYVL